MSTLNRAVFVPTVIVGIYRHEQWGTYHLRNLSTGQMLHCGYSTIDEARVVQELLENSPDNLSEEARQSFSWEYYQPKLDMSIDALIDTFSKELAAWNQMAEHPLLKLGASHV